MRNTILTVLFFSLLVAAFPLRAQQRIRERVYVATDRDVYVAGDAVWMSAFCLDAASGALSDFSRIAYVELHSPQGLVQTAKIALDGGRGAGRFFLQNTLPTGNYRLLAYTALGAAEAGFDPLDGARTLSVFNTFSTARQSGVVVTDQPADPSPAMPSAGGLEISAAATASPSGTTRIRVSNRGAQPATFSFSVRHLDDIPAPAGDHVADFVRRTAGLAPVSGPFDPAVIPEYEGEIIRAHVTGTDAAGIQAVSGKAAYLSSPGSGDTAYTALIGPDGVATFFTSNIYGEQQELFLEIEGVDRDNICHLELLRPFRNLPAGEIPPLTLSPSYAASLELRTLGMQLEKHFDADTLYEALPVREHRLFNEPSRKSYILDDYTRFPVMEELFVEFIPELRLRRVGQQRQIQVLTSDVQGNYTYQPGRALVLLDGIPVLDHEKILAYDPLLVKRIDIYMESYFFGARGFWGIVNFVTYKGNLPTMQFEDNVRIVDFQGCSLPLAYTCEGVGSEYPDYRQTLLWQPLLTLGPGESVELECKTPAYGGRFEAVAEGLGTDGKAVAAQTGFTVE